MTYRELATKKPFVVNKNLGSALDVEPEDLNNTNAEGDPVIIPTQKQKYDFDRQGWLLIPNIFSEEDIREMREFCKRHKTESESISTPKHFGLEGPLQKLVDHPIVVGFLNEFLAYPPLASEDCYGFRLEETEVLFGSEKCDAEALTSNTGNGLFRLPGDSHIYRCVPGRGWSGLTRAIWELSDVNEDTNVFRFITGSHKSAYSLPESLFDEDSQIWETYHCSQGSLLLYTESISQKYEAVKSHHSKSSRVRITYLYNTVSSRWSNWTPNQDLLDAMPTKRKSLFRDVYTGGNVINGDFGNRTSAYSIEKD